MYYVGLPLKVYDSSHQSRRPQVDFCQPNQALSQNDLETNCDGSRGGLTALMLSALVPTVSEFSWATFDPNLGRDAPWCAGIL